MNRSNYLEPRFSFREAAEAAAFPLNTLRSYYQRGWFESFARGLKAGRGRAQMLCLGDVLVLAIASRLIDQGERPINAYTGARPFGLIASTPKNLLEQGHPRRLPFELFNQDEFDTYLLWRRGSPTRVIAVPKDGAVPVNAGLDEEGIQFGVATSVILLNAVERTVFKMLGLKRSGTSDAH